MFLAALQILLQKNGVFSFFLISTTSWKEHSLNILLFREFKITTIKASDTLKHQPTVWPVPCYHCPGDMAVPMRKLLARPWVGVLGCNLLLLLFLLIISPATLLKNHLLINYT